MKSKYFFLIFIVFFLGIIVLLFNNQNTQYCEKKIFSSISLIQKPISISLINQDHETYISIENRKRFIASSLAKSFFRSINPLCSDTIYKFQDIYFTDYFCLTILDLNKTEICRGKKLQRGYPIILKKEDYISNIYIQEVYYWDRIEELIKNFKEDKIVQFLIPLIDKRIIKLPEKSFISSIEIDKQNQKQKLIKKENQWFYNDQKISNTNVTSFINEIVMLEHEIDPLDLDISSKSLTKIFSIDLILDFENWKFSLFQNKNIHIDFFQNKESFLVRYKNYDFYVEPQKIDSILKKIENIFKQDSMQ